MLYTLPLVVLRSPLRGKLFYTILVTVEHTELPLLEVLWYIKVNMTDITLTEVFEKKMNVEPFIYRFDSEGKMLI